MKTDGHPWKSGRTMTQRRCRHAPCGKAFTSTSEHARFCSDTCRKAHDRAKRSAP